MPRKPDPTLKPAIISKVAQHLQDTKLEDVSVRSLGRVLGTSAYPIVYHFGSRDALVDELGATRALVASKATPEEAAAFGRWLVDVAQAAADAAKEGGFMGFRAEQVSAGEQAMLDRVREAVAT